MHILTLLLLLLTPFLHPNRHINTLYILLSLVLQSPRSTLIMLRHHIFPFTYQHPQHLNRMHYAAQPRLIFLKLFVYYSLIAANHILLRCYFILIYYATIRFNWYWTDTLHHTLYSLFLPSGASSRCTFCHNLLAKSSLQSLSFASQSTPTRRKRTRQLVHGRMTTVSQATIRYKHSLLSEPLLPIHIRVRLSLPITYYRALFILFNLHNPQYKYRTFRAFYNNRIGYLGYLFKAHYLTRTRFSIVGSVREWYPISRTYSAYLFQLITL